MSLETQFTFYIEFASLYIAHHTGMAQVIQLFQFLCSSNSKTVDNNRQDETNHDLVDEYHINVLEYAKNSNLLIQATLSRLHK